MTSDPLTNIEGTLHSDGDKGVVRMSARYETVVEDLWSALTDPERLAQWYGTVKGDFNLRGEFTAVVWASGWDGRGRIDTCVSDRSLAVTMWEQEGAEHSVAVELAAEGTQSVLALEVRGVPLDFVWAYGAGWQVHMEDLGIHLTRREGRNLPSRWEELEPLYREMPVEPLGKT
jgi:uncharacterized protein YndB with AHSA1/START domain